MMKLLLLRLVNAPWLFLTEDFMERAATASSVSGQPYELECVTVQWRRDDWRDPELSNKEDGLDSLAAEACPRCQELLVGRIWTIRASAWDQDINRPS